MDDADAIKVGNTDVRDLWVFRGTPYTSSMVTRRALTSVFPEAKIETKSQAGEEDRVIASFPGAVGEESSIAGCEVASTSITIEYLFRPQTLGEFQGEIDSSEKVKDQVLEALRSAYDLPTASALEGRYWNATTQAVRCVGWLRAAAPLDLSRLRVEGFMASGWTVDPRCTFVRYAFHSAPSHAAQLPPEYRRRIESLSTIDVGVTSAEEWETELGIVRATLRDIAPRFYIEILKHFSLA